jgi:predicted nucleotidyltransferase
MAGVDQLLLDEIVRRILSVAGPELVIMFGSASSGSMTRDSDIDLLVVETSPGNAREKSIVIRKALRGLGFPFDVIVVSSERFYETKNVIGGIAYPACKYGKVIYEAA